MHPTRRHLNDPIFRALIIATALFGVGEHFAHAQEDLGSYGATKCQFYTQTTSSGPVADATNGFSFYSNLLNGGTGSILTSSTLTTPSGGAGTVGYVTSSQFPGVQFQEQFNTQLALDTAFPDGAAGATGTSAYQLTIYTSTPNSYPEQFTFGPDNYPNPIPQITNGTWSNGNLIITDPTQAVTITWPAFTGVNDGNGGINFSISNNSGFNVSQNFDADGTNTSYVIAANTLTNNSYYNGSLQFSNGGSSSGTNFQEQLNFTIQVGTPPDVSNFDIQKEENYDQGSSAAPTLDPRTPFQFSSNVNTNGGASVLLSTSTITPPGGSAAFYDSGTNGLYYQQRFISKSAFDTAYPTGTYNFAINTSTPNAYTATIPLTGDNYPPVPQIISATNATWSGGALVVTDVTLPVTVTWNTFNSSIGYIYIGISNSSNNGQGFTANGTNNSYTFPAGTFSSNKTYEIYLDFSNDTGSSSSSIPGASYGVDYQTQTQFLIQTGTGSTSKEANLPLVYKETVLQQTSNSTPSLAPTNLPEYNDDTQPYGFSAQSSVAGSVTGPGSGSPYALGLDAGSDGAHYRYSSGSLTSLTGAGGLNTVYPDGTYTFKNAQGSTLATVSLTGDVYPNTPQILTVNGLTPTWNSQGQLVLDPTIDNVITWTPFTTTNASFTPVTGSHETAELQSNNSNDAVDIDLESGVVKPGTYDATATFSSMLIPANTMVNGNTYDGDIQYFLASSANFTDGSATSSAGYITANEFTAVASTPTSKPAASFLEKNHVVMQSSNSVPVDVTEGTVSPSGNLGPYSFSIECLASGSVTGPGGPYALTFNSSDQEYEYNSPADADQAALDTATPNGAFALTDGNTVNETGNEYPAAPQLISVNGSTPIWTSTGQLELDPTIQNTLTWATFPTTYGTFASNGYEEIKILGNQDNVSIKQDAIGFAGGTAFNTYTIAPNTMTSGNTYAASVSYQVSPTVLNPSANTYDLSSYLTENVFTIAPEASTSSSFSVVKQVTYQQTSASAPATIADPYTLDAFGAATGLVTGVTGAGQPGPYTLSSGATSVFEYSGASYPNLANLNTAYPDGAYIFPDGTSVNLTGDTFPTAPQITEVNGAAPVWNGNGQLVLNPDIANTITWTAYPGSFTNGEESVTFNTTSALFTAPPEAFGQGSGSLPTTPYTTMTIPAGAMTAGSTYPGSIEYSTDSTATHLASGSYDTARYEALTNFVVLASFTSFYDVLKNHIMVQTSNSAPVDAPLGNLTTGDYGPYSYEVDAPAAGTVTGPDGSYVLSFDSTDQAYENNSGAFSTQAGLDTAFPNGSYTLSDGDLVNLTGNEYPAPAQLLAVNGALPIWDTSGQLDLNPAVQNTLTWSAFPTTYGAFSSVGWEQFRMSGKQDGVNIDTQNPLGVDGGTAFTSQVIPAGTLTTSNTYSAYTSYYVFPTVTNKGADTYDLAIYKTANYYTIFASGTMAQSINGVGASAIPNQVVGNAPITLNATSSSGLAVTYTVTGPATITGATQNILTVTGPGVVTLTASAAGTSVFAPASTTQTFTVNPAPPVQQHDAVTILHSFADGTVTNDGEEPSGNLVQGSDGYFYGVTSNGGSANQGSIFKISPQGQLYLVHSFGDGSVTNDGASPVGSLIQAKDGNFYGVTMSGGSAHSGSAYKVTPGGQVTILHSFEDDSVLNDGASPQSGLIQASDGNFYGVCGSGGSQNDGAFYQMTVAGQITILHSFLDNSVANDGVDPVSGLVQGTDGNFYGTTYFGGSTGTFNGKGTIFKMTPQGNETILHSLGDGSIANDGANPQGNLVQGSDGNFYGTTTFGGSATNGTVFKITPQGAETILHSFGDGSVANDGGGPDAGLLLASDGSFYGMTFSGGSAGNGAIFKMSPQGQETILHSFLDGSVANDGASPTGNVIQGTDGSFYGMTQTGGAADEGTVFRLILGAPQLTSPATATGTLTLPFSYQTTTSSPTVGYSATGLPAGLTINAQTGLITGTPTTTGTTTATITLTGIGNTGTNTAQVTFTIVPLPTPAVTSIPYAFGSVGTSFTYTPSATNNPTGYSATGLTGTGLMINPTTGAITGNPTTAGTYPVAITATNAAGTGAPTTLTIQIFATTPTLSQEYVVLHRFNDGSVTNTGANIDGSSTAADGQNPFSIFQAFDGTYYGTSSAGGTYDDGVFFNMTDQGTTSIVANFSTSGASTPVPVVPQGGIQGADGNFYIATEFGGDSTSYGNFAVVNPATGAHSNLHNFGDGSVPNDGQNPQGPPVQDKDGNFYGVTLNGGTANEGTVYKINSLGVETVLHSFGDNSVTNDGAHPVSALIQDSSGNLYGTTPGGGANGEGTIYEITTQGVVTILYSFGSVTNDGTYPAAALVLGTDDYLYGTTQYGGTSGTGTIFKFGSQAETILHNFNDGSVSSDGSNPSSALIQGIDGNFYGTTLNGGSALVGTILEMTSGGTVTIIHNFGDGTVPNDGANPGGSLYQDTNGNFYGTTLNGGAGTGYGTAFVIVATQTTTHIPVFTGASYATGSVYSPFSYTPTAMFGVLASGEGGDALVSQNGAGFSTAIITKDTTATSWAVSGTGNPLLPNDLYFNTTTGAITGTPLEAGTYTVIVTPQNSIGKGAPETVTLYIDVPPVITSATTAGASAGVPFSYQITGTAAPSSFGAIGLPSWLTVNTVTGVISGTPPGGGTYSFTPTATNYAGTGSEQVVLSVTGEAANGPTLSSPTTANGTAGTPFTYTITASNPPNTYSALLLPAGLTFDPNSGIISGTPTTAGTYSIPIGATNDNGNTAGEVTITIAPAGVPSISTPLTASCNTGQAFSYQIPATGLIGIFNATGLPHGLSVNAVSGLISGTPIGTGTTAITLTAANTTGTAAATLDLTVSAIPMSTSTWLSDYPTLTGGLDGTPMKDRVPNLLKYLCNIDPITPMAGADFAALPTAGKMVSGGTTYLTLSYRQWASATGVTVSVETSSDMVNWSTVTPGINEQTGTDPNTGDPIMTVGVSTGGANKMFMRLNVSAQ